jgi:hypothetical protein
LAKLALFLAPFEVEFIYFSSKLTSVYPRLWADVKIALAFGIQFLLKLFFKNEKSSFDDVHQVDVEIINVQLLTRTLSSIVGLTRVLRDHSVSLSLVLALKVSV